MICPRCRLHNPPDAWRCDCDYDFRDGSFPPKDAFPKRSASSLQSSPPSVISRCFFAVVTGFLGTLILVACFRWMGHPEPASAEYPYTDRLLVAQSLPFAAAYFTTSASLVFFFHRAWLVALGMVLPWPSAFVLEVSASSSSHNLFPFEVALVWLPALIIALLGAGLGKFLAGYRARRATPNHARPRTASGCR